MKTVDSINFFNKRAIVRVDFNVPLNDSFQITDSTRIKAAIATLKKNHKRWWKHSLNESFRSP